MAYNTLNTLGIDYASVFSPGTPGGYDYGQEAPFEVGTVSKGTDGSEWVYVQFGAGGVTGPGYVVGLDPAFEATMLTTTTAVFGNHVAVAPAVAAADDFGWVQRAGPCQIQVAASCAANVVLAATATAGQVDDAAGDTIPGMILTTARGGTAGLAPGLLNYPTIGVTSV